MEESHIVREAPPLIEVPNIVIYLCYLRAFFLNRQTGGIMPIPTRPAQ